MCVQGARLHHWRSGTRHHSADAGLPSCVSGSSHVLPRVERTVLRRYQEHGIGRPRRHGLAAGAGAVRANSVQEWEVSERRSHAPLVDESTFIAVQRVRAARPTKSGETRRYALAGLVVCGECGRRMDAHWVHGRAGYRCRHGYTTATPQTDQGPAMSMPVRTISGRLTRAAQPARMGTARR